MIKKIGNKQIIMVQEAESLVNLTIFQLWFPSPKINHRYYLRVLPETTSQPE